MPAASSRQRLWQLAHERRGLCAFCSEKRATSTLCLKHAVAARERARARNGTVRRFDSLSYRLEAEAKGIKL